MAEEETPQKPVFIIRPQFDQALAMVYSGIATVVSVPLITMIGGTLFYMFLMMIGLGSFLSAGVVYGLLFAATLVLTAPVFFEVMRSAYRRTVFSFYNDYLDYQYFHFFMGQRRGRIRYVDIADVSQESNTLQEQRRLTTVSLHVPRLRRHPNAFAGIRIPDVPQAQDYLTHIIKLIEKR